MRVAFAVDNLNVGGTELNAVRTAERLVDRGLDLRLVALQEQGPLRSRYEALGVPITPLPLRRLVGFHTLGAALRLGRWLRSQKIDVLHAHDMYSNVFAVPTARLAQTPLVVASRRWWRPPQRFHEIANRWAYRFAHTVLANSRSVGELVKDRDGVGRDRIVVVPNFLDEEAFEPPSPDTLERWRDELGVSRDAVVVGAVANLLPVKDHATLIRGFAIASARHRGARLVLVGDGPCRPDLESLARQLGVAGRVCFAGRRPPQPSLHYLFDVSALTSTSEGLPNTLLEAMAAGRPVVATDVGAVPDIVDRAVGRLVPPSDPGAVGRALDELFGSPGLRARLGGAGRRRAMRDHSATAAIDRLMALYETASPGSEGSRPSRLAV